MITLLQALNLVYYLFCAKFYTLKPIEVAHSRRVDEDDTNGKGDGVELVMNV